MIKKCEELLAGLKKLLPLAQEIQSENQAQHLDVMNIEAAIHAVDLRIGYLKNQAEAKAKAKEAKTESENSDKE